MRHIILFLLLFILGPAAWAQQASLSPNLIARLMGTEVGGESASHAAPSSSVSADSDSLGPSAATFRATIVSADADAAVALLAERGIDAAPISSTILTATLSLDAVAEVSELPGIVRIELGAPVRPTLALTRADVGIDYLHSAHPAQNVAAQAFTGEGVIVGIVDTGFEYGHAAFRSTDGTLRISRVWEQDTPYGRHPARYNYGTELLTSTEILNARCDNRTATHGTHVAGSAAGSDFTCSYYGMAPDAELVLVAIDEYSNSSRILDGVKYIFDYAESVGRPCVVNLSLGSHLGPHDGTSAFDQALDELCGPGRIVVGAVGNEGDLHLHASHTFTPEEPELKTSFSFVNEQIMESQTDIWGEPGEPFSVSVIVVDNLKGQVRFQSEPLRSDASSPMKVIVSNSEDGATGYIELVPDVNPFNQRHNVLVDTRITSRLPNRNIGFIITGADGTTVHAWNTYGNDFVGNARPGWTVGDSHYTAGEIGGTGRSVISVGAYQLRNFFTDLYGDTYTLPGLGANGDAAYFTSHGPTLDDRTKPDVIAPGVFVCGPVSQLYYGSDVRYNMEAVSSTTDGALHFYYPMTGTSMAAPVVTGTVACWLQADASLTPDRLRDVLAASCRIDFAIRNRDVNSVGFGKLDAYNGMQYILGIGTGVDGIASPLADGPATDGSSYAPVYDLSGRLLITPRAGSITVSNRRVVKH